MDNNLKESFIRVKYEPENNLKDKIWQRIVIQNRRILYFKTVSFSILGISSLLALIPVVKILISDFTNSGFYEYLSLAFSKDGLFSSYSKEFIFSLAESLPTISIVASLSLLFLFFLSLKYIARQIINNKYMGQTYVGI